MASSQAGAMLAAAVVAIAIVMATTAVAVSDGSGPRTYLTSRGAGLGARRGRRGAWRAWARAGATTSGTIHGGHDFNFRGEKATIQARAAPARRTRCSRTPGRAATSAGTASTSTADNTDAPRTHQNTDDRSMKRIKACSSEQKN
ncbi:hypothetical protein HU200_032960 [Digitaria exilis]|uniref:Uncharacterized protein n=1 Tax=Digitaria exilis TaxID=1010633 RepID=A0A835BMR1_9POAL|nr:hypothetical protein HU200_032960 [Digitaria exilis]